MAAVMNGIAAARRLHPLRRHLPHLQRLQPQRDPHGGADEAARRPRVHARFDRPRRGRPDAPVDRARGVAAPDPATSTSGGPATRSRRSVAWAAAIESRDRPSGAAAVAPEPAATAPRRRLRRRRRRRRLRSSAIGRGAYILAEPAEVGLAARGARGHHRHRLRGAARAARPAAAGPAGERRDRRCASSRCRRPASSTARSRGWKESVLPAGVPRIAVEMGASDGWWKYGCAAVVGIDTLRRVGAGAGALQALRLHRRKRRRHGARGDRAMSAVKAEGANAAAAISLPWVARSMPGGSSVPAPRPSTTNHRISS